MDTMLNQRFLTVRRRIIDDFFKRMNPMQRQAVYSMDGPVLILAGAGSGKTTVLINRIANMIQFGDAYNNEEIPEGLTTADVDFLEAYAEGENWEMERAFKLIRHRWVMPWNILAITFTNKAAGELRERLSAMLGGMGADVNASTFHSCCARILRREIGVLGYDRSFTIYDTEDSLRVIRGILRELRIDDKQVTPKSVLAAMGRAKDNLLTPQAYAAAAGEDFFLDISAKVYAKYQKQLKSANAVDFDDIIMLTVQIFQQFPEVLDHYRSRFRYIMVDEYQDTNKAQFELVRLLSAESKNLCVVGDDDQSIYKFRGATIENILQFEDTYPGTMVIRLEQNYRSTGTILDVANEVIKNNKTRKGKTLWTENGEGDKVQVYRATDEHSETRYICGKIAEHVENGGTYGEQVVLYRMNAQAQVLEQGMVKAGIPYRVIGGLRFYDRKEIRDIVAYLSVLNNRNDTLRLRRIINEPKRKIGDSTVAAVQEIADGLGESVFTILETADQYAALGRKSADLMAFARMMNGVADLEGKIPLDELLDKLLDDTGYMDMLRGEGIEGLTRMENIFELKSTMKHYEEETEESSLAGFLEEISLYTDIDRYDAGADAVVLMTMHAAKGLEFDTVYIAGMEDGIFPGVQSIYNEELLEEERRLAYVSITRAKKRLYITNAAQRMMFGQTMRNRPSLFLKEIPQELYEFEDGTVSRRVDPAQIPAKRQKYTEHGRDYGVGKSVYSDDYSGVRFRPGDAVFHKTFGDGMIVSSTQMGKDQLLEIAFDSIGTKKLMATFARLTKKPR